MRWAGLIRSQGEFLLEDPLAGGVGSGGGKQYLQAWIHRQCPGVDGKREQGVVGCAVSRLEGIEDQLIHGRGVDDVSEPLAVAVTSL